MATEARIRSGTVGGRRLWFGLAGSAAAWLALGFCDVLITWRACVQQEQFATPVAHPGVRVLYIVVALALFLTVLASGTISYCNWRALSGSREILQANATERREFMAAMGVIVSATLGLGVLWLAVPPFFFQLCARAR